MHKEHALLDHNNWSQTIRMMSYTRGNIGHFRIWFPDGRIKAHTPSTGKEKNTATIHTINSLKTINRNGISPTSFWLFFYVEIYVCVQTAIKYYGPFVASKCKYTSLQWMVSGIKSVVWLGFSAFLLLVKFRNDLVNAYCNETLTRIHIDGIFR